jgi:4-alpha-glucanotransferase
MTENAAVSHLPRSNLQEAGTAVALNAFEFPRDMKERQSRNVGHSGARNRRSTVARIERGTRLIEQRLSGILLHISSLPGRFGIGDLGSSAYEFVDFLCAAGQSLWSVLPLNPVLEKPDFCPYSPISAFATNHLLISPEKLLKKGFLEPGDLEDYPRLPSEAVDFPEVVTAKSKLLRQAFERFRIKADEAEKAAFRRFCDSKEWLLAYAAYVANGPLSGELYLGEWKRGKDVARPDSSDELHNQFISFGQFVFFEQWKCLRNLGVPVTEKNVHWEFIRLALSSVAKWALIPAQDLLGLGSEARMNLTGVLSPENWRWRLTSVKSLDSVSEKLFNLTQVYGRLPNWR